MKKALYTIAVLSVGFGFILTGSAQATAPKAGDIPDIRALDGNALSGITDLDNFVADFDDYNFLADTNMDWSQSARFGSAPLQTLDSENVLSLDSASVGDEGTYDFIVQDSSGQQSIDTSNYKASSGIGLYPAVSYDALLSPDPTLPVFTYVLDAPNVTGAVDTTASATVEQLGASASWAATYINAAYDASGNGAYSPRTTLASGVGVVSAAGLDAGISSSGLFTLTSTGSGLSEPVIVGFQGDIGGAGDNAAVSVLVSNALLSVNRNIGPAAPGLDIDDGFETAATGEIARVGFNQLSNPPNRRDGAAENTWVNNVGTGNAVSGGNGYVSAVVIAESSLPGSLQDNDFDGDHSGQVLQVSLEADGGADGAYLTRNAPVPADPGFAYAVEMSVATNAAAADVPNIGLGLNSFGFSEVSIANLGAVAPNANGSSPALADGWLRVRAYLEPSSQALTDGGGTDGLTVTLVMTNSSASAVDVYIDNVSIYKTILPNDASYGAASVAFSGRPDLMVGDRVRPYVDPSVADIGGQVVYGNFENGTGALSAASNTTTGANTNGWLLGAAASVPAGVTVSVGSSQLSTQIEAGDANWITANFNAPAAAAATQILSRVLTADAAGSSFDPGIYVMSLDYFTPSGSTVPATVMALTDDGFTNYSYNTIGNGTNGAVRRIRVPAAMIDVDKLRYMLVPTAQAGQTLSASFDNVTLEKVDDALAYWDSSLVN